MDNQHKLIKGYRDLSQAEIDLMNEVKAKAEEVEALVIKVRDHLVSQSDNAWEVEECVLTEEQRRVTTANPFSWHMRATENFQDGFMKLVRSIAQPTTF